MVYYQPFKSILKIVFGTDKTNIIHKCFCQGVKDKCRGFGYVTFALAEDAKKAKDSELAITGRKVKIAFSDKRPRQKPRNKKGGDEGTDNRRNIHRSVSGTHRGQAWLLEYILSGSYIALYILVRGFCTSWGEG